MIGCLVAVISSFCCPRLEHFPGVLGAGCVSGQSVARDWWISVGTCLLLASGSMVAILLFVATVLLGSGDALDIAHPQK